MLPLLLVGHSTVFVKLLVLKTMLLTPQMCHRVLMAPLHIKNNQSVTYTVIFKVFTTLQVTYNTTAPVTYNTTPTVAV